MPELGWVRHHVKLGDPAADTVKPRTAIGSSLVPNSSPARR
jgi:hypothetical protein